MALKKLTPARAELATQQVDMAKRFPDTRLGIGAIILLTDWSKATIHRRCKAGQFPGPIEPGKWRGGEVLAYLSKEADA